MKFYLSLGVVIVCSTVVSRGQSLPSLTFVDGIVHVYRLDSATTTSSFTENDWQEILSVYTDESFRKSIGQPIAGKYLWSNNGLSFEPTFPFSPGMVYHAVFSAEVFTKRTGNKIDLPESNTLELVFEIPKTKSSPSFVESIYPESTVVPENLLRMYIYFSTPMMPGEAYDHIKLFNHRGEPIDNAFLIVDQELWDKDRKRFTILFDPGRIKRGLKANLDLGPPLTEGEKYYVVVDSMWRDANGNYLQNSLKKFFHVTHAKLTKLSIKTVNVIVPSADSRQELIIHFDRPMDHVLVSKYITIHHSLSEPVSGDFQLTDDTTLRFKPDNNWKEGSYTLEISPLLEDVAGNNFNNAFDLDLSRESRINSIEPLKVELSIKPAIP